MTPDIVAADRRIKRLTDNLSKLTQKAARFQTQEAYIGVELLPDTHSTIEITALDLSRVFRAQIRTVPSRVSSEVQPLIPRVTDARNHPLVIKGAP